MKLKRFLLFFTILAFFLTFSAGKTQAQTILYQDNFDHGSLDNWYVARNQVWGPLPMSCMNGVWPSAWQIEDGMLGFTINGTPCVSEIFPLNLDLSDVDNYQVDFDWIMTESIQMDRNMVFRWQDTQNWYGIKLFGNNVLLQKVSEEGNNNGLKNGYAPFTFEPNGKYHFSITMTEDYRITVAINGQLVIDGYDKWPPQNIWDKKTIAFQASAGSITKSKTHFDNLVVRSLNSSGQSQLAMPHFKQNDPLWASHEYDSATTWSQTPTIDRWGCAITAMTMILHYHEINLLPNGTALTPGSLNDWLKSQTDGYIGQGLTNWLAITRLTQLVSQQYGTPKLEYKRFFGSGLSVAQTEIGFKKPVILQLPGHFVVGNGLMGENDITIFDPFYDRSLLSQHQAELLSTRTFEPSFTDLSYFLVAHDPQLQVSIKDEITMTQPYGLESFEEFVDAKPLAELPPEQTKPTVIHQLAKPGIGNYHLTISQPEFGPFKLEILAYDQQANLTVLTQTGMVGPTPLTFRFNYLGQEGSTITQTQEIDWSQLRQVLQMLKESGQFKKSSSFSKLDRLLIKAEAASANSISRHLSIWGNELNRHKSNLEPAAFEYLLQQTIMLKSHYGHG